MRHFQTPLCKTLGIQLPIFGFSHEPDVVVAIAQAGGFAVLGLARHAPQEIAGIVDEVEQRLGGLPYGIDLMLPANVPAQADPLSLQATLPRGHQDFVQGLRERFAIKPPLKPSFFTAHARSEALFQAQIDAVLNSNACAVATAIGLRAELITQAKRKGKLTFSLIGSVRHARKALEMGVDVLVAQGYDAGGHTGTVGTMSLLPQIVELAEAHHIPVLAAGGIATGEQVLASLCCGAQGAWLGTLWLAAQENHTPKALLEKLIASTSEDTVISYAHSGKPCRVVRSEWIDAWGEANAPKPLPMPYQQALTGDVFASIHEHNDPRLIYEAAGQSIFGIRGPTTVQAQMQQLVEQMNRAWCRLHGWAKEE